MPSGPKKRRAAKKKQNDTNSSTSTNPADNYQAGDVKTDAAAFEVGSKESDCHVDQISEAVSELGLKDDVTDMVKDSKDSDQSEGFSEIMGNLNASNQNVEQIPLEVPKKLEKSVVDQFVHLVPVETPENLDKSAMESVETNEKESEIVDEQFIQERNDDQIAGVVSDMGFKGSDQHEDAVNMPIRVKFLKDLYKSEVDSAKMDIKESEFVEEQVVLEGKESSVDVNSLHDTMSIDNLDEFSKSEGVLDTTSSKEPLNEKDVFSVKNVRLNDAVGEFKTLLEKGLELFAELSTEAETRSLLAKDLLNNLTQILEDLNSDKIVF